MQQPVKIIGIDFGSPDGDCTAYAAVIGGICYIMPEYLHPWADKITCRVDERGVHWLWQGWNNGEGHAKVRIDGKVHYLYRYLFAKLNGVTLGRWDYIDHTCENKPCLNAEHWDQVTPGVNTARGPGQHTQYRRRETDNGSAD